MEFKYFKKYSEEIILAVLEKSQKEYDRLKSENKISEGEVLKEKVISVYSQLYTEIANLKEEEFQNKKEELVKIIEEIRDNNKLTDNFVIERIQSREKLKGKSGAEVVKRLFEYSLKNLKKKRTKLTSKLQPILQKEDELESQLKEAIQYDEEMEISSKIVDIREEKRHWLDILVDLEEKIKEIETDLELKWKYLIYGNISQKELEKELNYKNNEEKEDVK